MAYHIYQTDGLVLSSFENGEDSKLLRLYTRALGVVLVKVQAARKEKSKHRYHTQNFSYGNYALVRGKGIWRLVGSERCQNFVDHARNPEKFETLVKVSSLLNRLTPEEDADPREAGLFAEFYWGMEFLTQADITREERKSLETLLAMKILYHYGYWEQQGDGERFFEEDFTRETLSEVSKHRKKLNKRVHEALEYSQL